MCGIAGYSLSGDCDVDRTLAAQALLAGIAERGADAVGYAYRNGGGGVHVHKQRSGASKLLDRVEIPQHASKVLVHVRDYTKGHPTIAANNHPVRHGAVVGVHNGIILNDEEIFAEHGFERAAPRMTVDSEAIFALAELTESNAKALEKLRGSMAAAWIDERRNGLVYCARGVGRPLWIGESKHATFFASTSLALEVVEHYTGVALRRRELDEGTLLVLNEGRVAKRKRFKPQRDFQERSLPPVRAPYEGQFCLERLATLRAAA
jgi:glucosamine 6-phosphate synthetase-like amidotransferase/phosphosugar isomerase protein